MASERALREVCAQALPHPRLNEFPTALTPWLLPVSWSRDRLWRIGGEVKSVPLEELRWLYDLPLWRGTDGRWFQVTPAEFLRHPERYPEHRARVATVDLSFPAHAIWRRGRWLLLDGVHRLVAADLAGAPALNVHEVTAADLAVVIDRCHEH